MAKYPFAKICEECSNSFKISKASARNQRFCSRVCNYTNKSVGHKETICLCCGLPLSKSQKKFCSRSCSATTTNQQRPPESEELRNKRRAMMTGRKQRRSSVLKSILSRGQTPWHLLPNRHCLNCGNDTGSPTRKLCSTACRNKHLANLSRLNPKCGGQKHTHRSKILNLEGNEFSAESSFEVKLAHILNELHISWIRPSFVWYRDSNNKQRRYYPDFYLPQYDIYLDPKNDYLIKTDTDKISRACADNNIRIVIISEDMINISYISKLVGLP